MQTFRSRLFLVLSKEAFSLLFSGSKVNFGVSGRSGNRIIAI